MIQWRIYYDDGTTFDSSQGTPSAAPSFGVQCIVTNDPDVNRVILHRWDYYFFHEGDSEWYGCDWFGWFDHCLHNKPVTALKAGRTIPTVRFNQIYQNAVNDKDFPVKLGSKKREKGD